MTNNYSCLLNFEVKTSSTETISHNEHDFVYSYFWGHFEHGVTQVVRTLCRVW